MLKKLLKIKSYPKYVKTINERFIRPRLLLISDLNPDFSPKFVAPSNLINLTEKELKHFDILSKEINIFEEINWYKDISSSRVWPKEDYHKIKISYSDNSDIKYIWEIGRLQFLPQLGALYKKTKQEKYAIRFKEIITDFYKENPIKTGPNWKCIMDVAIRAVNLIYSYNYFKNSESLNQEFWNDYFNNLYKTGQFIFNNLEWAPERGNHYLSDIAGLFYLGIVFKETKKGRKWLSFAKQELEKEIQLQITSDGVNFEGSTAYHRLVTELFFYAFIFGKDSNIAFSKKYIDRLKKATEFISDYTMNSGIAPQIGDNDNAQLLKLDNKRNINDYRYLLQLSDIYLKTKHNLSNLENETIFFANKRQILKYKSKPICKSFPCGFNIFRNKDLFLLIKCGSKNQITSGGHTHNDQLSFVLEYKGEYIFVDPGTYSYTGYPEKRNYFRSSRNHNTITINNNDNTNLKNGLFNLASLSKNSIEKAYSRNNNFFCICKSKIENSQITITRKIEYLHKLKKIIIEDNIISDNPIKGQFNFLLSPHTLIKSKSRELNIVLKNSKIKMFFNGNYKIANCWYSEKYGLKTNTKKININKDLTINKYVWEIQFL